MALQQGIDCAGERSGAEASRCGLVPEHVSSSVKVVVASMLHGFTKEVCIFAKHCGIVI